MDDLEYHYLLAQLMRHERFRLRHYQDGGGNLTVSTWQYPLARPLSRSAAVTVLEMDLRRIAGQLELQLPAFGRLDSVRQRVLLHMAFTMGVARLLSLRRFISAVSVRHWSLAAEEMLLSKWGTDDHARAVVLADMMRTGRDGSMSTGHSRLAGSA